MFKYRAKIKPKHVLINVVHKLSDVCLTVNAWYNNAYINYTSVLG